MAEAVDPVLAALIAKLPPSGSVWPAKKRAAWMQMIWTTFELVYDDEGEAIEMPNFLLDVARHFGGPAGGSMASTATPAAETKQPASIYAFYVDRDGYARSGDGTRILPGQVGGVMFDMRGEGDLSAIVWADGTMGVKGYQLEISPAQ